MEIGAAASALSIVNSSLKFGGILVDLYLTFRRARSEIEDRVTLVKCHWYRTAAQLKFIQQAWDSLHEEHQSNQRELLMLLNVKLESAIQKLRGLLTEKRGGAGVLDGGRGEIKVKAWKYVFVKPYLDATINDLERWQKLYDPSWFLIMKVASPMIDAALQRKDLPGTAEGVAVLKSATKVRGALTASPDQETHIFLPYEGMENARLSPVPYSTALCLQRAGSNSLLVVDSIPCPAGSVVGPTAQDVRRLAIKLRSVDPSIFGVLRCRGVVKMQKPGSSKVTSFEVVFEEPSAGGASRSGMTPYTLRSLLISCASHSLSDRVRLAKQLATSVNYVHTLDFVHKNVRPENLIGFPAGLSPGQEAQKDDKSLGPFFLIGFEQVRSLDGRTYLRGADAWEKNIYRHPDRQGPFPDDVYNMHHDIYSLGVCLLEIGLWSSFISYSTDAASGHVVVEGPGQALELSFDEVRNKRPSAIKKHLMQLARERLPAIVGDVYTSVVTECLTCLDVDDLVGDEDEESKQGDIDGVLVGVKYIENVLLKLNEISI